MDEGILGKVFDEKLDIIVSAVESWPKYATFEEDKEFSNDDFIKKYEGHRPVFWDMTNIGMPKPSDSKMQRITYSSYYNQNCMKGGIGLQPCGWIRVHDLWVGCVSDTTYQQESGIFELQQEFGENDLIGEEKKYIPFTNIFDKGYRNRLVAFLAGKQLTMQPIFAKSDRKFRETLLCNNSN